MSAAGFCVNEGEHDPAGIYRAMLAAAPLPAKDSSMPNEAVLSANWKGMDGSIAWQLIGKYARTSKEIELLMKAWLIANK